MKKVKLALIATAVILCFSCGNKGELDFSIVPIKGANGEYQYIDLAQKGKIVINPQFSQAHIFRDELALVKANGEDGKWGYIDKKGKFAIAPVYIKAQDFGDGVAWVQLEDQSPMLIDKNGKTILQIDSLTAAYPFSNGVAGINVYSQGQELTMFINKKGETIATATTGENIIPVLKDGLYTFQDKSSNKWGYKKQTGEIAINAQFDDIGFFIDEIAITLNGNKWGAIDKKGNFVINPQYDSLGYDGNGLFLAKVGKKWGWVNKKNEIVINPQFDFATGFNGSNLSAVQMGDKWGYIDKEGQIKINPQFRFAFPFSGDHAMVINDDGKIGFIDKNGIFAVPPLYDANESDIYEYAMEYALAVTQNLYGLPVQYLMRYMSPNAPDYQDGDFYAYARLKEKKEEYRQKSISAASGSLTDSRDNKTYKTIKIGTQVWMAENLNYVGDGYLGLCYGDKPREQIRNPENCEMYGRLYDWSEAMGLEREYNWKRFSDNTGNIQGICPSGWHLPSKEEWQTIIDFVGGGKIAGARLKSNSGWRELYEKVLTNVMGEKNREKPRKKQGAGGKPRGKGQPNYPSLNRGTLKMIPLKNEDFFGFCALPGGLGDNDGYFSEIGNRGSWWSSSEYNNSNAYHQTIYSNEESVFSWIPKDILFSVRCLKD